MPLPLVRPISIKDLEAEFLAPPGTPLSAFLKNGAYVPDNIENVDVPVALPLAITDFYGAANIVPVLVLIPQDPANIVPIFYYIPGLPLVAQHPDSLPYPNTPEELFVVRFRVKCDPTHVDSPDQPAQLPGYSWARQRMSLWVAPHADYSLKGLQLDIFFTSATTGYIRARIGIGFTSTGSVSYQGQQGSSYQDQPNTVYGNFVIPDDENYIDIEVSRGATYTRYTSGGSSRAAPDWEVIFRTRENNTPIWKQIRLQTNGVQTSAGAWGGGGALAIANNKYITGALCDLEISFIDAFVGDTVLPP